MHTKAKVMNNPTHSTPASGNDEGEKPEKRKQSKSKGDHDKDTVKKQREERKE